MNPKDYAYSALLFMGKPYEFINTARNIKWRYLILHFILVSIIMYIPVFALVVRTQPDQLYSRVYSVDLEDAAVLFYPQEDFNPAVVEKSNPAIYVFNDFIVYIDPMLALSAPVEFFGPDELSRSFGEIFGMIAVYNLYITQFLIPMLLIAFFVLFILQVVFYLIFAVFLGLFRLNSTKFPFRENVKIVIMSSLFPALICTAFGFLLPVVHIILFQMINILLLFFLSRRYDKKEKEALMQDEAVE